MIQLQKKFAACIRMVFNCLNGPGDPKDVPHAVETIRELLGKFRSSEFALAINCSRLLAVRILEKLKFGHRGGNHPVKELGIRIAATLLRRTMATRLKRIHCRHGA